MNRISPLLFLLVLGTPLLAQSVDSNGAQDETYASITLVKYCAHVETLSGSLRPRMFAQVTFALGPSSGWAEFDNVAAWRQAGRPEPLALVWYKESTVIRVVLSSGGEGQSYADYCYRPDGSLAQFRPVPAARTKCDQSLLHCDVKVLGGLRLYPPKGTHGTTVHAELLVPQAWAKRLDLADTIFPRPILQPERETASFAPVDWPEYLSVSDLPFNQMLYVSARSTE